MAAIAFILSGYGISAAQSRVVVAIAKPTFDSGVAEQSFSDLLRREIETAFRSSTLFQTPASSDSVPDILLDELIRTGRRPPKSIPADYVIAPVVTNLSLSEELREVPANRAYDSVSIRGDLGLSVRVIAPATGEVAAQYALDIRYAPPARMVDSAVTRGARSTGRPALSRPSNDQAAYLELAREAGRRVVERTLEESNAIQVIDRQGSRIWINRGSDGGWALGQTIRIVSRGRQLFDPVSGAPLGSSTTEIGKAKLVEVQARLSVAEITEATGDIAIGALVRSDGSR